MPKALSGCKVGPLGHPAETTRTRKENQGGKANGIFPGPKGSQWGFGTNQSARVYSSPPRKQQAELRKPRSQKSQSHLPRNKEPAKLHPWEAVRSMYMQSR